MVRNALENIFHEECELEKKIKYFIRSISHIKEQKIIIDELKKSDTQEATNFLKTYQADKKQKEMILIIPSISKIVRFQDFATEHLKVMLEKALSDKSEKNLEKWLVKRYFEYYVEEQGYQIETPDSMFVMIKTILTLNEIPRNQAIDLAFDLVEKRKILEAYKKKKEQENPQES